MTHGSEREGMLAVAAKTIRRRNLECQRVKRLNQMLLAALQRIAEQTEDRPSAATLIARAAIRTAQGDQS